MANHRGRFDNRDADSGKAARFTTVMRLSNGDLIRYASDGTWWRVGDNAMERIDVAQMAPWLARAVEEAQREEVVEEAELWLRLLSDEISGARPQQEADEEAAPHASAPADSTEEEGKQGWSVEQAVLAVRLEEMAVPQQEWTAEYDGLDAMFAAEIRLEKRYGGACGAYAAVSNYASDLTRDSADREIAARLASDLRMRVASIAMRRAGWDVGAHDGLWARA